MPSKDSKKNSALSVQKGVEQVNQLDENAVSKFKDAKKKDIPADQFLKEIL
ncbi:MAG: hypothetical protein K8R54_12585 [Bacteroidales bacterium]|nr:hypothetical protein [Bacteroidales bacterium]